MSAETELRAVIRAIDQTAPGVSSAKRNLGSLDDAVSKMATGMVTRIGAIAGAWLTVDRAFGATMAGIRNASELRDLHLRMEAVEGSIQDAAKALAFFDDAQARTRRTGDDLAKVYGEMLPQALAKGFSKEQFRDTVVQLDQFATRVGRMPSEINEAFAQILDGNARDKNPILRALGLDAEAVKTGKVNADQLLAEIKRVADEGGKMGDSLESATAKIQDGISDAFAKGWNGAEAETKKGVEKIKAQLSDPTFLGAIEGVGGMLHRLLTGTLPSQLFGQRVIGGAVRGISNGASNFAQWYEGMQARTRLNSPNAEDVGYGLTHPGYRPYPAPGVGFVGLGRETESSLNYMPGVFRGGATSTTSGDIDLRSDEAKRKAQALLDAADKIAQAHRLRAEALRFEIELLKAASPMQRAEVEYMKELAAAGREATPALRALAKAKADLNNEDRIAAAIRKSMSFGGRADGKTWQDTLGSRIEDGVGPWLNDRLLGSSASLSDASNQRTVMAIAEWNAANAKARREWENTFDDLSRTIGAAGFDFARNAGKNLGEIAARNFDDLVGSGMQGLLGSLFGAPTQKNGKWYVPGSSTAYDSQDEAFGAMPASGRSRMQKTQAAFDFASIGVGAYGSAQAADGARTSGVVGGAMAGLQIAGPWGAVIGAVIGAIGGFLGEQQRQKDYKYGIPTISVGGIADISSAKNLAPYEREQIIAQVQETYERTRNAGVRTLMTLGQGVDSSVFKPIDGKFQDNPSANWGKHLQQWISMGLPDDVMGQMKGQFRSGFGKVGLQGERFDAMWAQMDKLDPQKMLSMLSGLARGLTDISEAMDSMDARRGGSWQSGLNDVQQEMSMSFAQHMGDAWDSVIEKASYLDDLVGEDQISLLQEIGQMTLDIRQREREEMRAILELQESIKAKREATVERYTVMGMVKEDGSPDYEARMKYNQTRADEELAEILRSNNREDVSKNHDDYYNYIDKIVADAFSVSDKYGQEMSKWAINQLGKGDSAADTALNQIGADVQSENAKAIAKFQPIIDSFTTVVSTTIDPVGNVRDKFKDLEKTLPDVDRGLIAVTNAANVAAFAVTRLAGYVDSLVGGSFESDVAASRVA